MVYGRMLIIITLYPDGTLDGGAIDYFDKYESCFEKMVELSVLGQGKGYTCIDDYVDLSGDMEESQ